MHFHLDPRDDLPLFAQLARQLRQAIAAGTWPGDRPLPSVRGMVSLLKVNQQTVLRAYGELEEQGLIERRQGQGTFVVPGAVELVARQRQQEVLAELQRLSRVARELGIDDGKITAAVAPGSGGSDDIS